MKHNSQKMDGRIRKSIRWYRSIYLYVVRAAKQFAVRAESAARGWKTNLETQIESGDGGWRRKSDSSQVKGLRNKREKKKYKETVRNCGNEVVITFCR